MNFSEWLHTGFFKISNFVMAAIPRNTPSRLQFQNAKIMAHRGIHDNATLIKENTLAAFQKALDAKVWGIELDIRWTRDFQPVVHHDATTQRVFGKKILINSVTLAELQNMFPEIPSLKQVADRFGKKIKLVIEFKAENYLELNQRKLNLQQALKNLNPMEDFYFISLEPELLQKMNDYPSACYFPIGRINLKIISDLALQKNYAGIMGHYIFTKNCYVQQQLLAEKQLCTGFVESKNAMFRELNRGITILSSNHADKLQAIINRYLML